MTEEVLFARNGQLGVITLNRPYALNALTLTMIRAMQKQLNLWQTDDSIKAVLLTASPSNAFCAGGDVRWLYQKGREHSSEQMHFFKEEYRLNQFIHDFSKPYIALMDGITMGGGVGVSLHGSHPVATERFVFAMPETSIGFFPDIGSSYLLNRCPGSLGIYLGLTGNRLGPQDAIKAKLIKYVINSEDLPRFIADLKDKDLSGDVYQAVDDCLKAYVDTKNVMDTSQIKPQIDVCFAEPTIELIIKSLMSHDSTWAESLVNTLGQKSPLSLKVTLAQLHKTKNVSLEACLEIDSYLVKHFMKDKDFYEGVRALLIDKDKEPKWNPSRLELVSDRMVDNYFPAV